MSLKNFIRKIYKKYEQNRPKNLPEAVMINDIPYKLLYSEKDYMILKSYDEHEIDKFMIAKVIKEHIDDIEIRHVTPIHTDDGSIEKAKLMIKFYTEIINESK